MDTGRTNRSIVTLSVWMTSSHCCCWCHHTQRPLVPAVETHDSQDHQWQQEGSCCDNRKQYGIHVDPEDGHKGTSFRNTNSRQPPCCSKSTLLSSSDGQQGVYRNKALFMGVGSVSGVFSNLLIFWLILGTRTEPSTPWCHRWVIQEVVGPWLLPLLIPIPASGVFFWFLPFVFPRITSKSARRA